MPSPPDFAAQCALAKGGPKLEFMQARIWRWLKRNGPCNSPTIARAMRITDNGASSALQRMKATGHVTKTGNTRRSIWTAIGDSPPVCNWGQHPNSLRQLEPNWRNWYELLTAANAARGKPPPSKGRRRPAQPLPTVDPHPLSVSWRLLSKSAVDSDGGPT